MWLRLRNNDDVDDRPGNSVLLAQMAAAYTNPPGHREVRFGGTKTRSRRQN